MIDRNTTIPTKKSQVYLHRGRRPDRLLRSMSFRASARWQQATRPSAASPSTASLRLRAAVPQIEVTFDIDANGIVNVSAKDLGTGKEQKITITASTNLGQGRDRPAQCTRLSSMRSEDKKHKEAVEVRNSAEQLVFQSEKALTDLGDKLSADEKAGVQSEIDKVKEALKGTDTDMIKAATEGLSKKFSDLAGKIYQQQAPQGDPNMGGQPGAGAQSGPQGDFVDADFTEVKDDDKK